MTGEVSVQAGIGFRPEFLDFRLGIRVGNLEENERITRILKAALEARYGQPFVTERWGRGVYWRWIGFLPKANRTAKPISSHVSFGCSKFFLSVNTEERVFECGLQVERGYVKAPREFRECQLEEDWDWHRLLKALKRGSVMEGEIARLLRERDHYDGEIRAVGDYIIDQVPLMKRVGIDAFATSDPILIAALESGAWPEVTDYLQPAFPGDGEVPAGTRPWARKKGPG